MKKYRLLVLMSILIVLSIGAYSKNDKGYSNYKNIDMQNIDISLNEKEELVYEVRKDAEIQFYKKEKENLEKAIKENEELKKYIQETVKKGEKIDALSYTECYLKNEVNAVGEVNSRILNKDEIKDKNVHRGKSEKKGRLTLISSLIAKKELVGADAYALSSVALWDNNLADECKTNIKDYISLCWPNTYEYNGVNVSKGYYDNKESIKFKEEDKKDDSGIVWSFNRLEKEYGINNVTVAVQIIPKGKKEEVKIFSSEYIYNPLETPIKLKKSTKTKYGGVQSLKGNKGWKVSSPIKIKIK